MTQQIINVGNVANDGAGDPLRDAFIKVNDNFTELYNAGGITGIQNGNSNIVIAEDSTINMTVAGVANVFVVSNDGTSTLGTMSANIVSASGNVTANYFAGNGRFLTGVTATANAAALTGTTLNANVVNSSLTSVGTLTSLFVAGNASVTGVLNATGAASFGNSVTVAQNVSAAGNIVANNIVSLSAVTFPSLSVNSNVVAANINTTGVYSTIVSAASNVVASNVLTANLISSTSLTLTATGNLVLNPSGNIDANNHWINNLADPAQAQDAATKYYVDSVVSGLNVHPAANAATTSDLAVYTGATVNYNNGTAGVGATLSIVGNTLSIVDGYPLSANDRLLVKNEANAVFNGVYVVNSSTLLTRATDFDTTSGATAGSYVFVTSGSQNAATSWVQTVGSPVIGTSNISFTQFSGGITSYGAGTGLNLNGTIFSVANTAVTAGSYGDASNIATFTVNQQGQLTAASTATVVAPAAYISGTTLSSNVVNSSLTSVGTLTSLNVSGDTTISTLSATGNIRGSNINGASLSLSGNVISQLRVTSNITGGNIITPGIITASGSIATAGNVIGGNINSTLGVFAGDEISAVGNITGSYFLGNGALLTGVGGYSNANVASYLTTYSGNLTAQTIAATGNISGGNLASFGDISTSGVVTGGNVSATSTVISGNVIAGLVTATGNIMAAGMISATGNITSTSIITASFYLGNVSLADGLPEAYSNAAVVANLAALGSNPVSTTGNITADYYFGNVSLASGLPTAYSNAAVVANLAALGSNPVSTTGNITAGYFIGSGSALTSITGANVSGTVANATYATSAGSATTATTAGTVTSAGQSNITSVGTLTSLSVSGSVSENSLGVGTTASGTTGEIRATNNITAYYSSDIKFKENVRPIEGAVGIIHAIGGKLFDWTDEYIAAHGGPDDYFMQKSDFGVIAQDVLRVFPMAVRKRPDGSLAVDYEKLSALAFAAIIDLHAEIRALKAK